MSGTVQSGGVSSPQSGPGSSEFGIHLTERAAGELRGILDKQGLSAATTYLRVSVKGGGCSGFTYLLDLAQQAGARDNQFESHGIKILCDPKSYLYVNGTTVDFRDELMGRGFVFQNPNATGTCGCGASFAA